MATQYHISNSGEIVVCHASVTSCPKDNFDSKYDAEQFLSQNYSSIPSASTRRTTALQDAEKYYGGKYVTEHYLPLPDAIESVLEGIRAVGNPLIVGGTVRDSFAGQKNKDFDIEVHGIDIDKLTNHLRNTGYIVDEVGKQFGVLKVRKGSIKDLDISVPRRENKTGAGHRSFEVSMDKNMTVQEAAERRDFTFNAIMYDSKRKVLIDPANGKNDYDRKIMRHVSEKFQEDPLRVLRGFQFAARFNMEYAPETANMCQNLRKEYSSLSVERVKEEWEKFFKKGAYPEAGIKALQDSGWDDTTPGLSSALKEPTVAKYLKNLQNIPTEKRVTIGAAIISQHMTQADRKKFIKLSVNGLKEQKSSEIFAEFSADSVSTSYDRKMMAFKLRNTGLSMTDIHSYSIITKNKDLEKMSGLAISEGVGDYPEKDLLTGNDILSKTTRPPGAWVGETVAELRKSQYRGELSNRTDAFKFLDTLLKKV